MYKVILLKFKILICLLDGKLLKTLEQFLLGYQSIKLDCFPFAFVELCDWLKKLIQIDLTTKNERPGLGFRPFPRALVGSRLNDFHIEF